MTFTPKGKGRPVSAVRINVGMDEKIKQFVSVTGASVETASSLLEACGGNLDLAVSMHMEGDGGAASTSGPGLVPLVEKSYEDL